MAAQRHRQHHGQLLRQSHQQIIGSHIGVGNVGGNAFALDGLEQLAAQQRLTATHLAHNLQEAFTATQGHQQGVERGLSALVWVKKISIRRDRKRGLAQ